MHPFPHQYRVDAVSEAEGSVTISAAGLPPIASAPPAQFDGPGDQWSPETLFVAAAVDCFVLTFKAIARASKLPWSRLSCSGDGVLERVDGTTRFTGLALYAQLTVPAEADPGKAKRLLEKAERACLITNSLTLQPTLTCSVKVG
jgi:organic hydroperoxide reductase OsmC/OhrA